mmetsp:Transcript_49346/g.107452  ORF Transcript_49346/g.107452 Transcript_49346/m.107452 type:complete len:134 (+) Transcript_49346:29-430(+)
MTVRQLYGAEPSQGLWRPLAVVLVVAAFCLIAWLTTLPPPSLGIEADHVVHQATALGSGRDQRGCLQTAGYAWCEGAGRCIRPWADSCPGGTEFCKNYCSKGETSQLKTSGVGAHSLFCRCNDKGEAIDYVNP